MGFRSQRDCCSIPSAAKALQVPEASKSHRYRLNIARSYVRVNVVNSTCSY